MGGEKGTGGDTVDDESRFKRKKSDDHGRMAQALDSQCYMQQKRTLELGN